MSKLGKIKRFIEGLEHINNGLGILNSVMGRRDIIDVTPLAEAPLKGIPAPAEVAPKYSKMNVKTIDERVRVIIRYIQKGQEDPRIREYTVKALSQKCGGNWCVEPGDHFEEVNTIFNALKKDYRYIADVYGKDTFQYPTRTLEFGGGDCDCASALLGSCLGSVGYKTGLRVIQTVNSDDWDHIYNLVWLPRDAPSRIVPLDLSVPKAPAGWQLAKDKIARHKDYEVPVI